jgi:hypothetical protein
MLPNPKKYEPDEIGGICRRFPAVFVPMKRDIAIAFEDVGVWTQPVMYATDWCGEFKPIAPSFQASQQAS